MIWLWLSQKHINTTINKGLNYGCSNPIWLGSRSAFCRYPSTDVDYRQDLKLKDKLEQRKSSEPLRTNRVGIAQTCKNILTPTRPSDNFFYSNDNHTKHDEQYSIGRSQQVTYRPLVLSASDQLHPLDTLLPTMKLWHAIAPSCRTPVADAHTPLTPVWHRVGYRVLGQINPIWRHAEKTWLGPRWHCY